MATSQLWTKQSESTDTEKQDLENYQNDKISDDYEDESPLYLPKNISNLTDPTYKNSYYFSPTNSLTPYQTHDSSKTTNNFLIEALGSQLLSPTSIEKNLSSETNAQAFINQLIMEKINLKTPGSSSNLHVHSTSGIAQGHFQTVCLNFDYKNGMINLSINSENIQPLILENFGFSEVRLWSLAEFDTRFLCLIVVKDCENNNNEEKQFTAHYFHHDSGALKIIDCFNRMLQEKMNQTHSSRDSTDYSSEDDTHDNYHDIDDQHNKNVSDHDQNFDLSRNSKKLSESRDAISRYNISRSLEDHRNNLSTEENSNENSNSMDRLETETSMTATTLDRNSYISGTSTCANSAISGKSRFNSGSSSIIGTLKSLKIPNNINSNENPLKSSNSTWSLVSSCLSEYASQNSSNEILNFFNDGLTHYLGYASLRDKIKSSEIALNLIEKLVAKSVGPEGQRRQNYFELNEKPVVSISISANYINIRKIDADSIGTDDQNNNNNPIPPRFNEPPSISKNIRTRYLAWIILSKNPKFLGIVEHADKFKIHLIYHEDSCKNIANCVQQACLIRYQKMVDNLHSN